MYAMSNLEVNVSEGVPTLSISLHEVEKLQALYPDYQIELRDGKIIIRGPSDSASGEIGARFSTLLGTWVYSHNLGRVLDASTGHLFTNNFERISSMSKKITSTILLFAVFIGFLWWGLSLLISPSKDAETIIFGLLLLGCAGYALVSILM